MKKTALRTVSAIGLTLVALWSLRAHAGPADLITGERVALSEPPAWTYSGAWRDDTLLLVDVLRESVRIYSADGRYMGDVPRTSSDERFSFSRPTIIQETGGGRYWLEDDDGRFLLLNDRLKVIAPGVSLKPAGPDGLRAVYQWAPAGKDLFVFGDIRKGEVASSAFLRVPVANPGQFKVLDTLDLDLRAYYSVGLPFVASVNQKPWYLVADEFPYVKGPDSFKFYFTFPGKAGREVVNRPELTKERGPKSFRTIFRQLEKARLPSGLYGRDGALFILVRTPVDRGRSNWSMMKFDPRARKTLWHYSIDSTANHLLVVPGEKYWAFVEKGPVESVGVQAVDSFLRVPAAVFTR
jgi:hypothetical protein